MDRNELRQACIEAHVEWWTSNESDEWREAFGDVDAVIRVVIEAVMKEISGIVPVNYELKRAGGSNPPLAQYVEGLHDAWATVHALLPSTDSEAVRDGIR